MASKLLVLGLNFRDCFRATLWVPPRPSPAFRRNAAYPCIPNAFP